MPKGDARKLHASLEDGHLKLSNLLVEALCCAPLSSTEIAVFLFVVRRTYGWASPKDKRSGRLDVMTAAEIAMGTGRPRRTVEKALTNLVRLHVILMIETVPGVIGRPRAYGPNPDVASWGHTREWFDFHGNLREAHERGVYYPQTRSHTTPLRVMSLPENDGDITPDRVMSLPENDGDITRERVLSTPVAQGNDTTRKSVNEQPLNPRVPTPPLPPRAIDVDSHPLTSHKTKGLEPLTSGQPHGDAAREGGESLPAAGTADGPALALVGQRPEAGPGTADDHDTPQPGEILAEFLTRRGAVVPTFDTVPGPNTNPMYLRPDGTLKSQEELLADLEAAAAQEQAP